MPKGEFLGNHNTSIKVSGVSHKQTSTGTEEIVYNNGTLLGVSYEQISHKPEDGVYTDGTLPGVSHEQTSLKPEDKIYNLSTLFSVSQEQTSPKIEDRVYDHGTLSAVDFEKAMDTTGLVSMVTGGTSLVTCGLSAAVFFRLRQQSAVNQFLLAINLANLSSGLILFSNAVVDHFFAFEYPTSAYVYTRIAFLYLNVSLRRFLYVHYCYVCLLNLLAVAYPMKRFHRSLSSRPKLTILGTFLTVLVLEVYLVLKYDSAESSLGGYRVVTSSRYAQNPDAFDTTMHFSQVCLSFLPLLLSALFNLVLLILLGRRTRQRMVLQEGQSAETAANVQVELDRQTIVILVSSLFFTVLSLPSNTLQIVSLYHPTLGLNKREFYLYKLLGAVFILCQNLSRFTSFLSYLSLSAIFRQQLLGVICPCQKRKWNIETREKKDGQVPELRTMHASAFPPSSSLRTVSLSTSLGSEYPG